MKYRAFISYSHAADGRLAAALQRALHRFAKGWFQLRALRTYRDETNLAATPELWPTIEAALDESEFFVLLASHEAAASKWVDREVRHWLEARGPERLLIVVTEGEIAWDEKAGDFAWDRCTALPKALRGVFETEPKWADLRKLERREELTLRNARFREAVLDLAAALHRRDKDELASEDLSQQRRRRLAASVIAAVLAALLVASVFMGLRWLQERDAAIQARARAERQAQIATVRRLLAESKLGGDTWWEGGLLILEAYRRSTEHGLRMPEVEQALRDAVGAEGFRTLQDRSVGVSSVAFSPDNRWVVAGCDDGIARLWSLDTYYSFEANFGGKYGGSSLDFLPDGPIPLRGHGGPVWATVFTPDSRRLITGGEDGTARVWDLTTDPPQSVIVLPRHDKAVTVMAISADGRRLATAGADGTCRLWDLTAEDPSGASQVLPGHTGEVCSLHVSPDNRWLATGSSDQTVRLWDLAAENPSLAPVVLGGMGVNGHTCVYLAFSRDSRRLVTLGADGSPRSWDLTAADPSTAVTVLPGGHLSLALGYLVWPLLAISPDGRWLATSEGMTVKRWALVNEGQLQEAVVVANHAPHDIWALAFTPDSRRLVTADPTGSVRVWDLTAPHPESTPILLPGGDGRVLAGSPDSHWLVGGGEGLTLWSLWVEDMAPFLHRTYCKAKLTEGQWRRYLPDEDYRDTCAGLRSEQ